MSEIGYFDLAIKFANDCLIPPYSASVVLHCAFLYPMPGEIVDSSGSIAAGKAAGCTIMSSNSSFKKLQLEFDRFPVPKQLSWVSLQRAEDARCAGRGMLVTKADTKGQITASCCGLPC